MLSLSVYVLISSMRKLRLQCAQFISICFNFLNEEIEVTGYSMHLMVVSEPLGPGFNATQETIYH